MNKRKYFCIFCYDPNIDDYNLEGVFSNNNEAIKFHDELKKITENSLFLTEMTMQILIVNLRNIALRQAKGTFELLGINLNIKESHEP